MLRTPKLPLASGLEAAATARPTASSPAPVTRGRTLVALFGVALAALGLPTAAGAQTTATGSASRASTASGNAFPTGEAVTRNIVEWEGAKVPPLYERSDQLPLTDQEVVDLMKAGFEPERVVKMIEERRCACDASAKNLIRMKEAGVPPEVVSAVSLHALPPNRGLDFFITLDFTGASRIARENFLYVFIDDGPYTRVLTANIGDLLARPSATDTSVDRSDLVLPRLVRRVEVSGEVPLKTYGEHQVLVTTSAVPTAVHPSELEPQALKQAQRYVIDYPRASLLSLCRLTVGYKVDPVLEYKWHFQGSRFECEWD